ncbi:VOC family protein [Rhodomicrobium lacus]|uniref:VOC family protein n=1 Tax=Rhodomicrobium lacus TaxID=2498452 RepID=UPI000F8F6A70|nr:VOC family protein [Rhodomicrobium lacus]
MTGSLPTKVAEKVGLVGSINHLRLTVTDIPRARVFYDPLLKFMGYTLVEADDKRLAWAGWSASEVLHWFILSIANDQHIAAKHDRYAPGFHHLAWNASSRADVDRFYALLLELGVTVLDAPAEYEYEPGYYAVFFADPDGLKLELVHVPPEGSHQYWNSHSEHCKHCAS